MSAALTEKPVRFSELAHFTDRQVEACRASDAHQFTLFGGFRGPGKSYWLRWQGLRLLLKLAKEGLRGVRGGLFCESYPVLTDRQLGPIGREFPRALGALRTSAQHGLGFHLKPEYGGGVLALRNLGDPEKYKSSEFAFILVDQLEQNPADTFHVLRGSLRWPGLPKPRFCGTANPGGIGHLWVRQLWVDRLFPRELEPLASEFAFVEAKPGDNPHLSADYWQMLGTLPDGLRQAWLEGNWSVFVGQVFGEWDPALHVVEPFEIPREWRRFRALDYGYSSPSAVGWFAEDAADPRRVYLYRELYERGLGPAELAETIASLTPAHERIVSTLADPSLFRKNEQTRRTNAEEMARNGVPCRPGHNDRLTGWRRLHDYLRTEGEGPFLKIFSTCPHTLRTLPALVYSQTRTEDVNTESEDHCADMLRYFPMSRTSMRLSTPPPPAPEEAPPLGSYEWLVQWPEQREREELAAAGFFRVDFPWYGPGWEDDDA